MNLDEAALRWGRVLLHEGEEHVGGQSGRLSEGAADAGSDLWGIGIDGCTMGESEWHAIDLACVMYAQDVAEGRHG